MMAVRVCEEYNGAYRYHLRDAVGPLCLGGFYPKVQALCGKKVGGWDTQISLDAYKIVSPRCQACEEIQNESETNQ